jgi:hypothetical protein
MNQVNAAFSHGQILIFIYENITVVFIHPGFAGTTLEKPTVLRGKLTLLTSHFPEKHYLFPSFHIQTSFLSEKIMGALKDCPFPFLT